MTDIYQSSSGPKIIAEMNYHNLAAAHAKLLREDKSRVAEIEAMGVRLAVLDAENSAARVAEPVAPGLGHNSPPPDSPYEAHATYINDLYVEAKVWADGADIANAAQFAEVSRLIDYFSEAIKAAEASRDAETKPLQAQVKAVQEKYWQLVGDTKTVTGVAIRAKAALLAVKTKWINKVQAERDAEARRLREEAERQAQAAREAIRASAENIEAREAAEDLVNAAHASAVAAKQAEKPIMGVGMRDDWVIKGFDDELTEDNVLIPGATLLMRHMWKTRREEVTEMLLAMARTEIREGKRQIPGLLIVNERKAVR